MDRRLYIFKQRRSMSAYTGIVISEIWYLFILSYQLENVHLLKN